MSLQLISRSPDLRRLREAGYSVRIVSNYLVVDDIPYVTSECQVEKGTLVSELTLAGDVTSKPKTHVVMFSGKMPCDEAGHQLTAIVHSSKRREIATGLTVDYQFSSKPTEGYPDYYEKMTTYATLLSGPAQALDPNASPRKYRVVEDDNEDSVFSLCGHGLEPSRHLRFVGKTGVRSRSDHRAWRNRRVHCRLDDENAREGTPPIR